jgi:hypothetical protein
MYIVGVDPGLAGAIAVLDTHGILAALADTPTLTLTLKVQRGTRQVYDVPGMAALLRSYAGYQCQVCIEESQPMPGQGTRSMFTTGYGYGLWIGLLTTFHPCCATKLRLSVVCIRPCTSCNACKRRELACLCLHQPQPMWMSPSWRRGRKKAPAHGFVWQKSPTNQGKIHQWCVRGIAPRRCEGCMRFEG